MPQTRTETYKGKKLTFNWPYDREPTNSELREIAIELRKPELERKRKELEAERGQTGIKALAEKAAVTVLEPFYHKNIIESGKTLGQGAKELFTQPEGYEPTVRGEIERVAGGIRKVGGGALGVVAPTLALSPTGIAKKAAASALLGPVSKALGYGGEKIKEGIEYVSPASKEYPELTGLAGDVTSLAAAGKAGEAIASRISKAKPSKVAKISPKITEAPPIKTPQKLLTTGETPYNVNDIVMRPTEELPRLPGKIGGEERFQVAPPVYEPTGRTAEGIIDTTPVTPEVTDVRPEIKPKQLGIEFPEVKKPFEEPPTILRAGEEFPVEPPFSLGQSTAPEMKAIEPTEYPLVKVPTTYEGKVETPNLTAEAPEVKKDFINLSEGEKLRGESKSLTERSGKLRNEFLRKLSGDTLDAMYEKTTDNQLKSEIEGVLIEKGLLPERREISEELLVKSDIIPEGYYLNKKDNFTDSDFPDTEVTNRVSLYKKNGDSIGHIYYGPKKGDSKSAVITDSYLDKKFRGLGIGKELYLKTIEDIKVNGFNTVYSDTQLSSSAEKMWESLGATNIGDKSGKYTGRYKLDLLNVKSKISSEKVIPNEEVSPELEEYNTQLSRAEIEAREHFPTNLRQVAERGMLLGKSFEDVTADIYEAVNKSRRNVPIETIDKIVNRVFEKRAGEAGFLSFRGKRVKAIRMTKAAEKGRPPEYEEVKADSQDISKALSNWFSPVPRVIKDFGGGESANELARLLQVERTHRNQINGEYTSKVLDSGLKNDRTQKLGRNITDEEVGNYRVKDIKTGEEINIIPEGKTGANEHSFIQYRAGEMEVLPGYELIEPIPGNLLDVLESNVMPMNDNVANIAKTLKSLWKEAGVREENSGAGMRIGASEVVPFKAMLDYDFPRKYSKAFWESLGKDPSFEDIAEQIAKKDKITIGEARAYLQASRKNGEILSAPQHARLSNYKSFIRDRSIIFDHIKEISNAIGRAEVLGPKDVNGPIIENLLTKIKAAGGDDTLARAYVSRIAGRDEIPFYKAAESKIYKATSAVMTAKYLTFFPISNLATIHNIAVRGSFERLLPALVSNLKVQDRFRSQIISSGALSEAITDQMVPSGLAVKLYKIRGSEQYLRSVASEVGQGAAQDMLNYMKEHGNQPDSYGYKSAYKRLQNMLLKNDVQMEETLKRGKLTDNEIKFAGGRMAEMTQGLADPVDMPYSWSGAGGGLLMDYVFTYKRFAYASSKILIEAIKENPEKVIPMLLVTGALTGELLGDAKAALKGGLSGIVTGEGAVEGAIREIERRGDYLRTVSPFFKDHPYAARYIDDMLQSWAFGLISDGLMAAVEGPTGVAEFVSGPFFALLGEIGGTIRGLLNTFYRDESFNWDKIEKEFERFYPGSMGPAIRRSEKATEKGKELYPSHKSLYPTVNAP